jgi:electron transfer flavoprotein beta subunit
MAAKKKPVEEFTEIESEKMSAREISVEIPKMESACEVIPVEDLDQTAAMLVKRLKEERYL